MLWFCTKRWTLPAAVLAVGLWLSLPSLCEAQAQAPSPTGRNPKLLWTPQRQAVWNRMRREHNPWWTLIRTNAENTGTKAAVYGDIGAWATLAYQITGDRRYAERAWHVIEPIITRDPRNADYLREYFEESVLLFDWLYPSLSSSQRATFVRGLNRWCDWSLGVNTKRYTGGFRVAPMADCDQTVSQYFGLAFVDLATGPDNALAGTWLKRVSEQVRHVPLGGLKQTGNNRQTVRNTIADFVRLAQGGESIESAMYNMNTLKLLFMGAEGVRTASGRDYFPEVTAFASQAGLAQLYELSPDLKESYQWGDEEHPRDLRLLKRVDILGMLAGLTQDDPHVGPYVNQLVHDLVAKYGLRGYPSAKPFTPRMLYVYNPFAPRADWRGVLPRGYFAAGRGLMYFHDGWKPSSSFMGASMMPPTHEDHETHYFGDFQLYRHGEWAVTHPIGYGPIAKSGAAANSMVLAGLSSTAKRGPVAQEFGPNGSYAYLAGTAGGAYYPPPYPRQPPVFWHEWTRSILYLPASDHGVDNIIVFDRVNADDPRRLPSSSLYRPPDRAIMREAPNVKEWIIHSPVAPTIEGPDLTWRTSGGQTVDVRTLLPRACTAKTYDEKELWGKKPATYNFNAREKKFQTRLAPSRTQTWDTFLNVVQVHDGNVRQDIKLVESPGKDAQGVLLQRAGQEDVMALFGARPQKRVLTRGYMVRWDSTGSQTAVYLFDLNPTRRWQAVVDGGSGIKLEVSSQGVARITAQGAGSHTLTLKTD